VDKAHLNFMSLVSLSSCFRRLLRPRLAPRPVSHVQYKYINFRQDRGQYQVHIPGRLSKCFGTRQEAITATCQAAGETRQSLVLAQSLARDRQRHLFSALWKVFSRSSKGKKVVCLPADLSAAILAAKESKQMYKDSPALLAICLRGKVEPFKKFLRQEWESCKSYVQSSGVDPELTYMCLQNVVRRMAAPGMRKTLDLWADNIGKNVSHHSGWLANCLKLHVIEKVADNARGSGVLVLGKDRGRYKLLVLGSILQNMPTPKSTSEWMAAIMSARTDADNCKFDWKSLEYLWPWMLRSHMIAQTRT